MWWISLLIFFSLYFALFCIWPKWLDFSIIFTSRHPKPKEREKRKKPNNIKEVIPIPKEEEITGD